MYFCWRVFCQGGSRYRAISDHCDQTENQNDIKTMINNKADSTQPSNFSVKCKYTQVNIRLVKGFNGLFRDSYQINEKILLQKH